jgi:hypothetical protein
MQRLDTQLGTMWGDHEGSGRVGTSKRLDSSVHHILHGIREPMSDQGKVWSTNHQEGMYEIKV